MLRWTACSADRLDGVAFKFSLPLGCVAPTYVVADALSRRSDHKDVKQAQTVSEQPIEVASIGISLSDGENKFVEEIVLG